MARSAQPIPRLRQSQTGFTIIEVLVALVVLTLGLLGIAATQLKLSQYVQAAGARSQSSNVVMDAIEKMRSNRNAAILFGAYNTNFQTATPVCTPANAYTRYAATTSLNNPNGALAANEVAQLRAELACLLPAGDVQIITGSAVAPNNTSCNPTLIPSLPETVTIIIRYDDRKGSDNTAPSATGSVALMRCITEVVQL